MNIVNENSIQSTLGEILCRNKLTISTAESCTGGMISAKLISYPGISSVFLEGAVTYSNESKIKRLGVKKYTIDQYGAVSQETAREMVEGISKTSGSYVSVATTGIAGPGGGTDEKPVGLVYIATYIEGSTKIKKCKFDGTRDEIRALATNYALKMLKDELNNKGYK